MEIKDYLHYIIGLLLSFVGGYYQFKITITILQEKIKNLENDIAEIKGRFEKQGQKLDEILLTIGIKNK